MVFPVVLRGQPGPRLATTPTKTTTSKPVVPRGYWFRKCSCQTEAMTERVEWLPPATPTPTAPEDVGLPPAQERSRLGRLFGPLAVVGAFLAKFKGALLLLPKLK